MSLVVNRSDLFPPGTTVGAFSPPSNRHIAESRPTGTPTEEAVVDAAGTLTYSSIAEGIYNLYAVVAGVGKNLRAGSQGFTAPGTLRARIKARREAAGVI